MTKKYYLPIALGIVLVSLFVYFIFPFEGSTKKGKTVIMAFGDSLTYGQGDRDEEGYVGKLEAELNTQYPDKEFMIENHGVKGRESAGVIKELALPKTAKKLKDADYFILFIGTNDLINSNGRTLENINRDKAAEAKEKYVRNVEFILGSLRAANEDAPILLLGIYNPYPQSGDKIEPIIDDWNRETVKIAMENKHVKYVATNNLFKGKDKKDFFSDSLHLNERGYELLEEKILSEYNFGGDQKQNS